MDKAIKEKIRKNQEIMEENLSSLKMDFANEGIFIEYVDDDKKPVEKSFSQRVNELLK